MTHQEYRERLDEIFYQYRDDYNNCQVTPRGSGTNGIKLQNKAKQAITSLIKELVAEAKPNDYVPEGHQPEACLNHEKYTSGCCGCQKQRARLYAIKEFEQNLLKELEG